MNTTAKLLAATFLALLCVTACGSSVDPGDSVLSPTSDIFGPVNEQDLREARQFYDEGRRRWESHEPFPHILTVGVQTISEVRIEFDADGNVVAEEVVKGDPEGSEVTALPRSVDEVFATVDGLIRGFEDGTTPIPEEGECGHHFGAHFDTDLGVPSFYDTLGPCDDGVGVEITVTRIIEN